MLPVDDKVYRSEMDTNQRNLGISFLLKGYNRLYHDPVETVDLYTRQCSVNVSARDLSIMAATLANYGINPITKEKLIDPDLVPKVLSIMVTAGMYEASGGWLYQVGLPAKSGVGGAIIAIVPGKYAIAGFSPRLDDSGNSIRSKLAIEYIIDSLGDRDVLFSKNSRSERLCTKGDIKKGADAKKNTNDMYPDEL